MSVEDILEDYEDINAEYSGRLNFASRLGRLSASNVDAMNFCRCAFASSLVLL